MGCNHSPAPQAPANTRNGGPKGELKFLLGYKDRMPVDVGFLTNHVVERRLANIMKDSFEVFMAHTQYARPIAVDSANGLVAAMFFSDSGRANMSATVIIDVPEDAIWADYLQGDSVIQFTDHPSMRAPGMFQ